MLAKGFRKKTNDISFKYSNIQEIYCGENKSMIKFYINSL